MAKELKLLTFRIGTETFAADIMAVRQIVPYEGSTAVPSAPSFVEGVIVYRSAVVPVIDLRKRFFPRQADEAQPLVMIASTSAGTVGLKVDEVLSVAKITTDDLLPAPAIVRGVKHDYLVAIVEQREGVLLVLDLEGVLTADEQRSLHEANLTA
jgi:purine-binding chemotaxis protein CheW